MCQIKSGHASVGLADVNCDLASATLPGHDSGVKDDVLAAYPSAAEYEAGPGPVFKETLL